MKTAEEIIANTLLLKTHLETIGVYDDVIEAMQQYAEHYHQSKVDAVSDEVIVNKAREIGSKFGKHAELDFGAGAEWLKNKLKQ